MPTTLARPMPRSTRRVETPETPRTPVVLPITQRSQVQIPPLLPRSDTGFEYLSGLLLVVCAQRLPAAVAELDANMLLCALRLICPTR